jgi:CheY-like chemotaxis protein
MNFDDSSSAPLQVLLVEDDEGDAVLVRELLADAAAPVDLAWARSLSEVERLWSPKIQCVVLDLQLPDANGLDGLRRLLRRDAVAVVVLTGLDDQQQGVAAVGAGAQDYLVKGQIDGRSLERVIRYAVQRHQAEAVARELSEAQLLAAENVRLSRGLLPASLISDPTLGHAAQYRSGGGRMLLGGDFYDVVQTSDGALWAVIGDVCGHGPNEAALGVCLRIAWRTLVLAGHPEQDILPMLQQLLIHERHKPALFTTVCMAQISPDRVRLRSGRLGIHCRCCAALVANGRNPRYRVGCHWVSTRPIPGHRPRSGSARSGSCCCTPMVLSRAGLLRASAACG